MAQSELEELSRRITKQVTQRWGKTDPCFDESWRAVLRDAAETIGLEINEPELVQVDSKENNRLKAKLDEGLVQIKTLLFLIIFYNNSEQTRTNQRHGAGAITCQG